MLTVMVTADTDVYKTCFLTSGNHFSLREVMQETKTHWHSTCDPQVDNSWTAYDPQLMTRHLHLSALEERHGYNINLRLSKDL
jgi:hypothetical protein